MDEKERFMLRYGQPSDDAIIAAGTTYLAMTGSVDAKAMEEAVKQAFRINSYKHSDEEQYRLGVTEFNKLNNRGVYGPGIKEDADNLYGIGTQNPLGIKYETPKSEPNLKPSTTFD